MIDLLSIIIGKDFSPSVEASLTLTHCCLYGIIWVIQLWYYAFLLTVDKIPYWKDFYVHSYTTIWEISAIWLAYSRSISA